jgi:hypothetical protein
MPHSPTTMHPSPRRSRDAHRNEQRLLVSVDEGRRDPTSPHIALDRAGPGDQLPDSIACKPCRTTALTLRPSDECHGLRPAGTPQGVSLQSRDQETTLRNRHNPLPTASANTVSVRNRTRRVSSTAAPRLALSPVEAAACLGCSRDFLPELRVVRKGRKVLVSIQELERWLGREAALTLETHRRDPRFFD